MSKLFRQVLSILAMKQIRSTAYHSQSQGALERFHQTLKNMLRFYCTENEKDSDEGIPYVLFAARDAVQTSLGFTHFQLVFGHTPKGPLKLIKGTWLENHNNENLLGYVARIKEKLWKANDLARYHLESSQRK